MSEGDRSLVVKVVIAVPIARVGAGVVVSPVDRDVRIAASGVGDGALELGTVHDQVTGGLDRKKGSGHGNAKGKRGGGVLIATG